MHVLLVDALSSPKLGGVLHTISLKDFPSFLASRLFVRMNHSHSANSTIAAAMTTVSSVFDPSNVNLDVADPQQVICYLTFQEESHVHTSSSRSSSDNDDHETMRGVRISAVGVLFFISTASILFPVLANRVSWLRLPLYLYLTMRYFGAGIIIATAFIHLLDPAYSEIGPQTCVGMTGSWTSYSWPPAIAMTSAMGVFLLDFLLECHVQVKYGLSNINVHGDMERALTRSRTPSNSTTATSTTTTIATVYDEHGRTNVDASHDDSQQLSQPAQPHSQQCCTENSNHELTTQLSTVSQPSTTNNNDDNSNMERVNRNDTIIPANNNSNHIIQSSQMQHATSSMSSSTSRTFTERLAIFSTMELGVIFHSIVIGLTLGVAGTEFRTIYPVLAFHQCFEGLGIGTRMSAIPFPKHSWFAYRVLPWIFCFLFGMITPIAVTVGLLFRSSYNPESFTATAVSGVLDSIAAGILLYTGFVELLARDFLFYPERSLDKYRVSIMIVCLYLGIAIMGLLGKWA